MFKLMVSIPAALSCFKDLKAALEFFSCQIRVTYDIIERHQIFRETL